MRGAVLYFAQARCSDECRDGPALRFLATSRSLQLIVWPQWALCECSLPWLLEVTALISPPQSQVHSDETTRDTEEQQSLVRA
jgi:hypothetical protein